MSGLITAGVAMAGAGLMAVYNYVFKMVPAENNIIEQFELIKANRP